MTFAVRLAAYAPAGARLGILPDPITAAVAFLHNDIGSLTLTYSTLARGGPWLAVALETGIEIAVEVNWADTETGWIEPYGGRFCCTKRSLDPTQADQAVTLSCPSYGWLLKKARNFQATGLVSKGEYAGQRKFTSRSAGYIMWTLLQEHFDRTGAGISLNRGFPNNQTSDSVAWAKSKTLYYPVGVDLFTVLDGLQATDLCDWRTDQRLLRLWNADSQWVDRSAVVRLDYGRELSDAPSEESLEDLFARIMVRGDKNRRKTYTSGTAPTPWGIWEGYAEAGGIDSTSELDDVGNKELAAAARLRGEYTRTLTMQGDSLPLRDYQPGDWVTGPAVMTYQRMRVQAITLNIADGGVWSGNVVLNDRVLAAELRRAKALQSVTLTNEAPAGSGVAPLPDVVGVDFRVPSAATSLTFTSSLYLDGFGVQHAKLDGTWTAVTTATDGTDLDVVAYELWGQPTGEDWRRITAATTPAVSWKPFLPGSAWLFKVRAIGVSTTEPGVDSATVAVTFPVDTVAPDAPSAPILATKGAFVTVTWNGLTGTGGVMPGDYQAVRVHLSTTPGFSPTAANEKALITSARGGAVTLSDLAYDTTYYVRFVAIDKTGNASAPSAQASITTGRLTDYDIASLSVAKLLAGTLDVDAWIKAGDTSGFHSMMDASGFSVYRPDPEGGSPIQAGHFGTGQSDFLEWSGPDGDIQAAVDETGRATFQGLSIPEQRDGYELSIYGTEFTQWLNQGPRGVVVRSSIAANSPAVSTESVVMEIRGVVRPGRLYRVVVAQHYVDNGASNTIELRLRAAYDGAAVGTTSTEIGRTRVVMESTAAKSCPGGFAFINTAGQLQSEREIRIAYTIQPTGATTAWVEATATYPCTIYIEDVGPALEETAAFAKYTSVWTASNTEAFDASGVARADATYLGYSNAPMTVGYCEGTLNYSLAIFTGNATSGETSKTLPTALSGATIEKVEIYLYNQWSQMSTLQVDIRSNTLTSIVNTTPSGTATRATISQGAGKWVDITSLWTGSSRGIWVGPTVTGHGYHGHIRSHVAGSSKPQLRITYRR